MQDDGTEPRFETTRAARTQNRTTSTMALSNRDRIGRMIELLPDGLLPVVEREMTRRQGDSWFDDVVAAAVREGGSVQRSRHDPQFLLNIVLRNWASYFRHVLPAASRNYVGELNDIRNRWAHNEPFNADDTGRALDTAERLFAALGAPSELADQVRRSRLEHQRSVIEAETRRATRQKAAMPTVAAEGLKPWREILKPHPDVARGDFNASEFAANLAQVANGEGAQEYTDPVVFFHRTYLTEGLRDLLSKSLRRIAGDGNASPTVNLQTNFGGGKTHSMLALYHLFAPRLKPEQLPQGMQELISSAPTGGLPKEKVRRAVLVGTALSPGQPSVKADGTKVNTLWGELAWQLGNREGYEIVAEADQSRMSPGSELLQDLLAAYAPCLVLIDEWVVYARQLVGSDDLPAGTFETHRSFAQSLTEAVQAVSGAQLVVSIPASDDAETNAAESVEVGGPAGQEALGWLQSVIHRKADTWRPASADESFEIVRHRLFEAPSDGARAEINKTARRFSQFYATHKSEFPAGTDNTDYEQRLRATYPIHPELFARLYGDWSTLERFQRTRGVLRLMSAVIHALWQGQNHSPMIMPGDIPLDDQRVASELTHYLEDRWKPILDADVDGLTSTPVQVDNEKTYLGQRAVSRRIARTIFLGSAATLKSARKGLAEPYIRLGMAMPDDTMGNFRTAINTLADRSTYLYSDVDRYWFDTHANITRTAKDEADRLIGRDEDVWAEIVRRLGPIQHRRGDFSAVHVAPRQTKDVPDRDEVRLVLLHPQYHHRKDREDSEAMEFALASHAAHGTARRKHPNMLVHLAPDRTRLGELMEAVREFLGWDKVLERHIELDLSESQRRQAQTRRNQAHDKVELRIGETYHWAIVPEQGEDSGAKVTWENIKVDTGRAEDAAIRTAERLKRNDLLILQQAPSVLHQKLSRPLARIWEGQGRISVGQLWQLHTEYPYMNRLLNRDVLVRGVEDALHMIAWEHEGFALATGYDDAAERYLGLTVHGGLFGQITDSTLLVRPDIAMRQLQAESSAAESEPPTEPTVAAAEQLSGRSTAAISTAIASGETRTPEGVDQQTHHSRTRFYAHARLTPEQYSKNASKYVLEILQHLDSVGTDVEVSIEIQATRPAGFGDDQVRTLTENANTLRLEAEFESE